MKADQIRTPRRFCQRCGGPILLRGTRRKFCSPECYHAATIKPDTSVDLRGRARARRTYPNWLPCEVCGGWARDRHHRNSNRLDNSRANIAFLCRKHHKDAHQASDGRVGGGPRPRIVALMRSRAADRFAVAQRLRANGMTTRQIATRMGVDSGSVSRWFRKYPRDGGPVALPATSTVDAP